MGDGVAADFMYPRPRDFSLALFKYKTSPGTLPPRDEDLFNTIKLGLPGTAMPGWTSLSADETWDVVAYVLTLAGTTSDGDASTPAASMRSWSHSKSRG